MRWFNEKKFNIDLLYGFYLMLYKYFKDNWSIFLLVEWGVLIVWFFNYEKCLLNKNLGWNKIIKVCLLII